MQVKLAVGWRERVKQCGLLSLLGSGWAHTHSGEQLLNVLIHPPGCCLSRPTAQIWHFNSRLGVAHGPFRYFDRCLFHRNWVFRKKRIIERLRTKKTKTHRRWTFNRKPDRPPGPIALFPPVSLASVQNRAGLCVLPRPFVLDTDTDNSNFKPIYRGHIGAGERRVLNVSL